ncbi:hypothetical protein, partial [Acinetobacter sp. TUM15509]|uniref:hypothetical protein n=1 Tax=Acinetobacter sp. TUM15509 TaxID=2609154 RepID=UPI00148EFC4E
IIVDGFDIDAIDKMDLNSHKYQDEIKIFLMDYNRFAAHTFDKSKVYFHTNEGVKKPSQNLNEYVGFKKHKNILNGKRSLIDSDIFFDFDSNFDYELKLSDEELVEKILELIVDIINKKEGDTELMSISKDLYFQGILGKVVEHIRYRHIAIRNKIYNDSLHYDR